VEFIAFLAGLKANATLAMSPACVFDPLLTPYCAEEGAGAGREGGGEGRGRDDKEGRDGRGTEPKDPRRQERPELWGLVQDGMKCRLMSKPNKKMFAERIMYAGSTTHPTQSFMYGGQSWIPYSQIFSTGCIIVGSFLARMYVEAKGREGRKGKGGEGRMGGGRERY
jgi:hypothetical protein